jgi:hypothetical protein
MPLQRNPARHSEGLGRLGRLAAIDALCLPLAPSVAQASTSIFTDTGTICTAAKPCWQAGSFGILVGLGAAVGDSATLAFKSTTVTETGAIGIGAGSLIHDSGRTMTLGGPIDFADPASTTSHGYSVPSNKDVLTNTTVTNGVHTSDAAVAAALSQVLGISGYWSSQTGTAIAKLGSGTNSIGTAGAGIQVFDVSSINSTSVLTITGGPNDLIVINDSGDAVFGQGINLNGLNPDQVLFNLSSPTSILSISGGSNIAADFVVLGSYAVTTSTVDDRILGGWGTLTLNGKTAFTAPPNIPEVAPEPGSWALILSGLGGIYYARRRIRPGR